MSDISIGGVDIIGNEVDVTVSASVLVESNPWLLRDSALSSRSATGHKSIEIETLSGKRVLVQSSTGTYVDVPKNNDDLILTMSKVFALTTVSVSATAVDAAGLSGLATAYKASMEYYAKRKIVLNKLNDGSISYTKKLALLTDLNSITGSGLAVTVPVTGGAEWEFAESGGLSVSYWSNGPYADIKISVVSRLEITI